MDPLSPEAMAQALAGKVPLPPKDPRFRQPQGQAPYVPPRSNEWLANLPRFQNREGMGEANMREVIPPELYMHYLGLPPMARQGDNNRYNADDVAAWLATRRDRIPNQGI